jgi:hypothetical protein
MKVSENRAVEEIRENQSVRVAYATAEILTAEILNRS